MDESGRTGKADERQLHQKKDEIVGVAPVNSDRDQSPKAGSDG
tara:strand:+ start:5491 stop:5619 length:129 start_codon:yes stop_codon:yes gene_type:complete